VRISKYFKLGLTQASLDFVDVDTTGDTKVFLSPTAISALPSDWGNHCVYLIRNFFGQVLQMIKAGKNLSAEQLLLVLREPNETHLGLRRGNRKAAHLAKGPRRMCGER
jgi:hypothetical protein